ncbi:MAG: thiol:disulfide interchange protein DsbA/DsbL [Ideonella sp.]
MNRRDFSTTVAGLGLAGSSLSLPALAQAKPVEGKDYIRLAQPQPVPPGKIEVIEFFWYGCPHCNAFEPMIEPWAKKLPDDVVFRRVPVAFRDEPFVAHQKIYYALEGLGQVDAMHRKVFYAIHNDRMRLDKLPDIAAFMAKNGIDAAKFTDMFNSFSVQTKANQARKLAEAYRIDGVPAMGIQGRFFTSGTLAGSAQRSLQVTDYLVQTVRKP